MKRFINICCLSVFIIVSAFSQTEICEGGQTGAYIHLTDASGFNDRCRYETELEAAVQDILLLTPSDQQNNFKVFDYGFYLLNNTYLDGVNRARSIAIEEATSNSTYYILFSKQSDESGIYSRIYVDFNLDLFPCIGNQEDLLAEVNAYASWEYDGQAINYARIEIEILQLIFNKIACCNIEGAKGKTFKSLVMDDDQCIDQSVRLKFLEVLSSMRCDLLQGDDTGALTKKCREGLENYSDPVDNIFVIDGSTVEIKIKIGDEERIFYFYIFNVPGNNELKETPLMDYTTLLKTIQGEENNVEIRTRGFIYDYGMVKVVTNYIDLPNYLKVTDEENDRFVDEIRNIFENKGTLTKSDQDQLLSRINCGTNLIDDDTRFFLISEYVLGNNKEEFWTLPARVYQQAKAIITGDVDFLDMDQEALVLQLFDDFENPSVFFDGINDNPVVGYKIFSGTEIMNKGYLFDKFSEYYRNTNWSNFELKKINSFVYSSDDIGNTWYVDKYSFEALGDSIKVKGKEFFPVPGSEEPGFQSILIDMGNVHFLSPIQIGPIETLFDIEDFDVQTNATTYLSALQVYEIDRINANQNELASALVAADVVLTFSGVGTLTKLRHLNKLPLLVRLAKASPTVVFEGIIPVTSFILKFVDSCDSNPFCNNLKQVLTYTEMVYGAGAVTKAARANIRESAKKAKANSNPNPTDPNEIAANKYIDDVIKATDNIDDIADGITAINNALRNKIINNIDEFGTEHQKLLNYVDGLSETAQATEIRRLNMLSRDGLRELNKISEFRFKDFVSDLKNSDNYEELIVLFNKGDNGAVKAWNALKATSFRTEIRWLESHTTLKSNDLFSLVSQATEAEVAAIHRYTVNNVELTRGAFLDNLTDVQLEWIDLIKSGLNKLRPSRGYQGKVFRGTNRPESEIIERYVNVYDEGIVRGITPRVNEPPLLSTSKKTEVAEDFIQRTKSSDKAEVMFEIDSRTGVDIDDISDYGENLGPQNHPDRLIQEEVIMSNDLDYEILDIIRTTQSDGSIRYLIKLAE